MHIVLASSSPRRSEILTQVGIPFTVFKPDDNAEMALPAEKCSECAEIARQNAVLKAQWTVSRVEPDSIVLAADTIVVVDGSILGKPVDQQDAARMLSMLSGRAHQVVTGVAVIRNSDGKMACGYEVTDVVLKDLSDREINDYVATGEPLDKAGAYAIQQKGAFFISSISGCYFNVVGLPVFRVSQLLREMDEDFDVFKVLV